MEQLHNMICPGCGCVCDDIVLDVEDEHVVGFGPECELGRTWFQHHCGTTCDSSSLPRCRIEGQPVSLPEAITRSARILAEADYPLIYGLSRGVTSGQRAAVALGETLGGIVDSTASLCHGPSIMALQEVGEVTSTLGEVRNRADLVIFWGCNPAASHPRHAERYSVTAQGRHTRNGRADRTIVIVGDADLVDDWRVDSRGTEPDLVIRIPNSQDFEVLSSLTAALNGFEQGHLSPDLADLITLVRNCRYGVVFFGLGLARTGMWTHFNDSGTGQQSQTGHNDVAALLRFVAEANRFTRMTARRMRLQGDVSGADNVLCWQTGYPFGVDFARGFPRYNPGEFTANELLGRGDVDACLLVGAETVPFFSEAARKRLTSIPTILLDYPGADGTLSGPTVQIQTAVHGIDVPGTIYRMDNVPMSLRSLRETTLPTDEFVLSEIRREYSERYDE